MSRKRCPFRLLAAAVVVAAAAAAAMLTCTTAELMYVGGKKGWAPNVNYTVWANQHHVFVEDWLLFKFDKNLYNVLEVNETNYLNCNDREFISNITKGGKDVFELKEVRPYYFLSGGGYCYQGMKLAVFVETLAPPAPSPANDCSYNSIPASWFVLSLILLATMSINSVPIIQ